MTQDNLDPRGLIRESYRIEGIPPPECRSIFLDWALGFAQSADMQGLIQELLVKYATTEPDHPMSKVLKDGLAAPETAKRRGGRKARFVS
ncbi:hypothetical protein JI58_04115 [Marinosulfonomonas sp. PRT-SC04]|nr:hypothetical protein JI58_04115 [Marinosulfonomonas sp. PRT-SC04]